MTKGRRTGLSLLELIVAMSCLSGVLGTLFYMYHVGNRQTSTDLSQAMISALVATERLHHDLQQLTFPDGPDQDDAGTRPRGMVVSDPGPDEGSKISFWIPRARREGAPPPRMQDLIPITYSLRPIPNSVTYQLVRTEGTTERVISGVVLLRLFFQPVWQPIPTFGGDPAAGENNPLSASALPADVLRVSLTTTGMPLTSEQLSKLGPLHLHTMSMSFLVRVGAPPLINRLREPGSGDHYRFLRTVGSLPGVTNE
jgi:hypothetical protein